MVARSLTVVIAVLVLGCTLVVGVAVAGRRDWTGSAACGSCHPRELAAWRATAHA
ncbi:MAG: hypothetical protein H0X17_08495, partial [Deltaproteobacteria bacterium]|nr:hypothetical protein [Deltaproteobacteria bacterium]